jgi:hypothetical protein
MAVPVLTYQFKIQSILEKKSQTAEIEYAEITFLWSVAG